ncbi:MAG: DUF481 domain-containing protein [Verrucomicrobiales bacterium]
MPSVARKTNKTLAVFFAWACFLIHLGLISSRAADLVIVHLKNGDRISGELLSESAAELSIQTKAFGRLAIPASEVQRREAIPGDAPAPPTAPVAAPSTNNVAAAAPAIAPGSPATATAPSTNKPPTAAATPAPQIVPKETPAAATAATPKGPKLWNSEVQLGLNLRYNNNESQEYLLIAKTTYAKKPMRHIFDYNFTYGRTEGILSANRMTGSEKTEFDLNSRWYLFNMAGAGYDEMRKIELQYEDSPGLGFVVITNSTLVLKSEIGFTFQQQFREDEATQTSYSARLGEIFTWRIWDKLIAEGRIELFPNLEHLGEYRFRLESTIRYPLTKSLSLNLILIDLYDTLPAQGVSRNDLQIRSSLGVKF